MQSVLPVPHQKSEGYLPGRFYALRRAPKPDNKPLSDAVEYVSGGGGEWILTVASKSGERKKYKSKHNIRKVSIRHINSKSHQNGAKTDILHALDSLETILKKEHTDEETD